MEKLDSSSIMRRQDVINRRKYWLHVPRRRNHVTHGKIKLKPILDKWYMTIFR